VRHRNGDQLFGPGGQCAIRKDAFTEMFEGIVSFGRELPAFTGNVGSRVRIDISGHCDSPRGRHRRIDSRSIGERALCSLDVSAISLFAASQAIRKDR
jgi:hypothetical protein